MDVPENEIASMQVISFPSVNYLKLMRVGEAPIVLKILIVIGLKATTW